EGGGYGARAHAVPEVCGTPRWTDLGNEPGGSGLDVHVHHTGASWRMISRDLSKRTFGLWSDSFLGPAAREPRRNRARAVFNWIRAKWTGLDGHWRSESRDHRGQTKAIGASCCANRRSLASMRCTTSLVRKGPKGGFCE